MANKHYKKSKKIGIDDKPYNKFLKRLYEKRVRKQNKNSENIEIKELGYEEIRFLECCWYIYNVFVIFNNDYRKYNRTLCVNKQRTFSSEYFIVSFRLVSTRLYDRFDIFDYRKII